MAAEREFDPSRDQVRAARQFVAHSVPEELADDAALVASELVTNAVEHAATPVTVRVSTVGNRVRVEVSDSSGILPAVGELLAHGERGRGLHLVERLTDTWGVESSDSGKAVWFEMELPGRAR